MSSLSVSFFCWLSTQKKGSRRSTTTVKTGGRGRWCRCGGWCRFNSFSTDCHATIRPYPRLERCCCCCIPAVVRLLLLLLELAPSETTSGFERAPPLTTRLFLASSAESSPMLLGRSVRKGAERHNPKREVECETMVEQPGGGSSHGTTRK